MFVFSGKRRSNGREGIMYPGETREIDGKLYHYAGAYADRKHAEQLAFEIRTSGGYARIIRDTSTETIAHVVWGRSGSRKLALSRGGALA